MFVGFESVNRGTPWPVGRQIGGTGLGLAIAHELISAMNGRIAAEKVERGARFYFELPRPDASAEPGPEAPTSAASPVSAA